MERVKQLQSLLENLERFTYGNHCLHTDNTGRQSIKPEEGYREAFNQLFYFIHENREGLLNTCPPEMLERVDCKFLFELSKNITCDSYSTYSKATPSLFGTYIPTNSDMVIHLSSIAKKVWCEDYEDCVYSLLYDLIRQGKNISISDENGIWDCEGIRARMQKIESNDKYPIYRQIVDPLVGGVTKTWESTQDYVLSHREVREKIADEHQRKAVFQWLKSQGKESKSRYEIPLIIALFCHKWFKGEGKGNNKPKLFTYPVIDLLRDVTGQNEPSQNDKDRIYKALELIRYVRYPNGKILAPFLYTSFSPDKSYINIDFRPFDFSKFGFIISPLENVYAVTEGRSNEYRSFTGLLALHIAFRYANKGYPLVLTYKELERQTRFSDRFIRENLSNVFIDLMTSRIIKGYSESTHSITGLKTFYVTPYVKTHKLPKKT